MLFWILMIIALIVTPTAYAIRSGKKEIKKEEKEEQKEKPLKDLEKFLQSPKGYEMLDSKSLEKDAKKADISQNVKKKSEEKNDLNIAAQDFDTALVSPTFQNERKEIVPLKR